VISVFMAQIEALQRPRTPNRTKRRSITVSKELHQHAHYLDARGRKIRQTIPYSACRKGCRIACAAMLGRERAVRADRRSCAASKGAGCTAGPTGALQRVSETEFSSLAA
jgi:hypothetical protein